MSIAFEASMILGPRAILCLSMVTLCPCLFMGSLSALYLPQPRYQLVLGDDSQLALFVCLASVHRREICSSSVWSIFLLLKPSMSWKWFSLLYVQVGVDRFQFLEQRRRCSGKLLHCITMSAGVSSTHGAMAMLDCVIYLSPICGCASCQRHSYF